MKLLAPGRYTTFSILTFFSICLAGSLHAQTSFGTVAVGSNSTQTVTVANLSSTPASFVFTYGVEFTTTSTPQQSCSGTPVSCSVQVQFAPTFAGLRQDGVLAEDGSGNLLGIGSLYGIGQASLAVFPPGVISTVAGTYGEAGGYGTNQINFPIGMVVDSQGKYVYFADKSNNVIRKMDAQTGVMTVYAGQYVPDGSGGAIGGYSGDGGPATSAGLNNPFSVALDNAGNLYIADTGNNVIRKVDPAGIISTVAGNNSPASFSGDGGAATDAGLNFPTGVAVDSQNNLYIADQFNNRIRKVSDGTISTFAGNGTPGTSGDGSAATSAELYSPVAVTVDVAGNVYISESSNDIRKVTTEGNIHLAAGIENGSGGYSGDGGAATSAELFSPTSMALDAAGNLYIVDVDNNVIREVDTSGVIHTIAGTYSGGPGYSGDGRDPTSALLNYPQGLAVSPQGTLFITDAGNNLIRAVSYAAPSFSFSALNIGSESSAQTATVENIGNAVLDFTGLSVSDNFVQTSSGGTDCSASTNLAVDASCAIAIAAEPTQSGSLSGNVTVTNGAFNIALSGTGNTVSLNPTSLNFGNQTVSTASTAQTVTLRNSGSQTLTITSISITGTNSGDFSATSNCGSTLAANGNCTISVTFTPSATGSRNASLSVSDIASGSPQAVALSGTGTGTAQISFSPASWSFGNQVLNTSSTAQSITVTNPGNAALTISAVGITGTNSGDFSQTNNCSTVAAGSGSCTIQVTFTPSATGSRSASISVTDNASGSPHTVSLTGTGTAPQISFSPTSWSFGNQRLNTTSTAQSITVTNPGTATLTVSAVSITGTNSSDFSQTNNCSTVAAGSGSCTIQVTFTPSATGSRSTSISVTDNASGSPHTVSLTGTGTAAQISFSPSSWNFGNQLVNTNSVAESITVTNPGTTALTITGISITGTNPGDFSQTNNCSTVAAGSGSCTIQVIFTPSAGGNRGAAVSVTGSASGSPHTVALSGTGTTPQISLSANTLTFGNQTLQSTSATRTVTISNPGTATLTISGISITGSDPADFAQTNTCTSLAPLASCTINVTYAPAAAGSRTATLAIANNSAGSPQAVSLNGTGVVQGPPSVAIDRPSALSGSFEGPSLFVGWALDNYSAITAVKVAVDGVPRGIATYSVSRPDVCQAYPTAFGCPNVGWTFLMDTGQLSNGTHTFSATAITADGRAMTTTVPFTVANWSSTGNAMTLNIDTPSTNGPALSGISHLGGWAVDTTTTITSVQVLLDGVTVGTAVYGGSRSDVCAIYANPGCPKVGWGYSLNTRAFSDGTHTLAITGNTADGQTSTITRAFTIANGRGSSTRITIDRPNSQTGTLSGAAALGGWAIDDHSRISEVDVLVDNVAVGTAVYGGLRTDVCLASPNRAGCPNVGWNFLLDTTTLTDGSHKLDITAKTSSGGMATVSSPFTVSNAASSTRAMIDSPSANAAPFEGIVSLQGWALDDSAAIAMVDITVDGVPFGAATYGNTRTDVCAAYPSRPGCPNVGWSLLLNTGQLANGNHVLGAIATTTDGRKATVRASFSVANWMAPSTTNSIRLDIDSPSSHGGSVHGLTLLGGWALADDAALTSVEIAVDNVPFGAAVYGGTRTDVCAAYPNRPGCPKVGWNFLLDTTLLRDGSHTLAVTGISAAGQSATITASFTVGNEISEGMRINIDRPNGTTVPLSGGAVIAGWAVSDNAAIQSVTLFVDGNSIGTASHGAVRNDVCAVYAGRAGCPNVGWTFNLDTTQFSNGSHTLNVTATTTTGQRATVASSFSVAN